MELIDLLGNNIDPVEVEYCNYYYNIGEYRPMKCF